MKKTIDTITARQRSRHYVNGRVEFDLPGRITNASQRETYKPAPEWQRNDGHKHIKSRGFI